MTAIYAIVPALHLEIINAAGVALGRGPWFSGLLTTDPSPTTESDVTHHHLYDTFAKPEDYSALAAAKAGTALPLDFHGNPVDWGVGGIISEADAYEAFAAIQFWGNDSEREPADFAEEQRAGLGLKLKPLI